MEGGEGSMELERQSGPTDPQKHLKILQAMTNTVIYA